MLPEADSKNAAPNSPKKFSTSSSEKDSSMCALVVHTVVHTTIEKKHIKMRTHNSKRFKSLSVIEMPNWKYGLISTIPNSFKRACFTIAIFFCRAVV